MQKYKKVMDLYTKNNTFLVIKEDETFPFFHFASAVGHYEHICTG
jgi:hypothetical protein